MDSYIQLSQINQKVTKIKALKLHVFHNKAATEEMCVYVFGGEVLEGERRGMEVERVQERSQTEFRIYSVLSGYTVFL